MNDKMQGRIPLFVHVLWHNLTGSFKEVRWSVHATWARVKCGENGSCEFAEVAVVTKQNEMTG